MIETIRSRFMSLDMARTGVNKFFYDFIMISFLNDVFKGQILSMCFLCVFSVFLIVSFFKMIVK